MKFQLLFIFFCVAAVSPTFAIKDIIIDELQNIIPNATRVFEVIYIGIKTAKGIAGQELVCYQCTNSDEKGACAQGNAAQQCEMRSLLRRFGSYLKAKFLGRPTVVPVCLRAEILVGEKTVTRHSCAMVNEGDALDEATCTTSLYMVGGVSGDVEKCELCTTDRCNQYKPPTARTQLFYEPYIQASNLVQSMDLGHVQHDIQTIHYKSNSPPLMLPIGLLIASILLSCIH